MQHSKTIANKETQTEIAAAENELTTIAPTTGDRLAQPFVMFQIGAAFMLLTSNPNWLDQSCRLLVNNILFTYIYKIDPCTLLHAIQYIVFQTLTEHLNQICEHTLYCLLWFSKTRKYGVIISILYHNVPVYLLIIFLPLNITRTEWH